MEFGPSSIGSRLLETITDGLYNGNLNCLREYIQNSIDANASDIKITYEGNTVNIWDNGNGMSKTELREAIDIGRSKKTSNDIGWRGIGIWSGVPACQRLVFITKKRQDYKYRLIIDCGIIRNNYFEDKSIFDVIKEASSDIEKLELGKEDSFEDSHYTIVRLENVPHQQRNLLDVVKVREFLSKEVPAPFNESKFHFAEEVNKWLNDNGVEIKSVNILLNGEKIYRNPTKSEIYLGHVIKKQFKVNDELVAVGWILTFKDNEKLKGFDKVNSGIYLKKKGFTLGDSNLVKNQCPVTYSEWQYGEIHILSKDMRENAARNDLERTSLKVDVFLKDIGDFLSQLQMLNRVKSDLTSSKEVRKYSTDSKNSEPKKIISKLDERIKKIEGGPKTPYPIDDSLQLMKTVLTEQSKVDKNALKELKAQLNSSKQQTEVDINNIKTSKERLNVIIDNLPSSVKKSVKRMSPRGYLNPELSVTDPLIELLKNKTGATTNELSELSKIAYGWESVLQSQKYVPKIALDKKTGKLARKRNLQFGALINTFQDIFVNLYKHEKGYDTLEWYESASDEEKYEIAMGMYAMLGFIYRLIEHSETLLPITEEIVGGEKSCEEN